MAKKNKSGHYWTKYRQLRNKVHRMIKKAKSEYYTNLLHDSKGNAKEFWKAFKQTLPKSNSSSCNIASLSVDDITLTSDKSIASTINSFFVNIGKELAKSSPVFCRRRLMLMEASILVHHSTSNLSPKSLSVMHLLIS
jgi:hypothetical protein